MASRRKTLPGSMPLHVLLTQEDDRHVAHCLEMDIVAEGPTEEGVLDELEGLIRAAVEYAVENDNLDHLFKPAPQECWSQLSRAKPLGERRIPIRLTTARNETNGFPYNAFDLFAAAGNPGHG